MGHLLHGLEISVGLKLDAKLKQGTENTDLICMAGALLRISAAWRINLADSTSARAVMILASPVLLLCAAMDSDSCNSSLKIMSLMSILSTSIPQPSATLSTMSRMSCVISSRLSTTSCRTCEPTTWRSVVCVRSTSACRTLLMPKAARCGEVMR